MAKTPKNCIVRIRESKSKPFKVLLKSGIMLESVVLNDKIRGIRFDRIYVDPAIDYSIVRTVVYPMIRDPRNVIIEDL